MSDADETTTPEIDPWNEYRAMITHCLDDKRVPDGGRRFVKGVKSFLEIQGYLSDKQKAVLKVIYESSINPA